MKSPNGSEVPKGWLRFGQVGDRVGKYPATISSWVRNGYLTSHTIGQHEYIIWEDAMKSRFFKREYEKYQASN